MQLHPCQAPGAVPSAAAAAVVAAAVQEHRPDDMLLAAAPAGAAHTAAVRHTGLVDLALAALDKPALAAAAPARTAAMRHLAPDKALLDEIIVK